MRFFLPLLLCVLLGASCGDDAATDGATVAGNWKLLRATRNNVETKMLDENFVLNFYADGSMETNLMGNEAPGTYLWEGDEIVVEGIKTPLTFTVKDLTATTMDLRFRFRGYQFDFALARETSAETPAPES